MVRHIKSFALPSLCLATLLHAAPLMALVNDTEQAQPIEAETLINASSSQRVDHIPSVERIDAWQALDSRHVLLNVDSSRRYVLTLAQNCHQLNWAQSVDVSRSGNAIWSQFDYVAADGWRCNIGTIHQLDAF
ncbi:MAG: DUF6491 family protein [Pseudomonadales bacterium]